jgi:peroxiredoxin
MFRTAKLRLSLAAVLTLTFPAYGQHDVHAPLIAGANRKAAPAARLPASDGSMIQIADFRGKALLVNFWATSCGGCVLEIPSFIALQQKYGDAGFTALGISADIPYEGLKTNEEAWSRVRPFMKSHALNYPIVMGNDAVIDAFGFQSYPATYLIDKSGRIAATYVGVVSKEDVEANIRKLLAEPN